MLRRLMCSIFLADDSTSGSMTFGLHMFPDRWTEVKPEKSPSHFCCASNDRTRLGVSSRPNSFRWSRCNFGQWVPMKTT